MTLSSSQHDYAVITLAASCTSLLCCVWMIAVYLRYRSPSLLGCAFNDLAAVIAFLQGMNSLQRAAASSLLLGGGSQQVVCSVSGTLDQLLSSAADVLMGCFFLYLGSSSARRRGRSWRTPYIVAALCGVTSTGIAWAVLQEVRMNFSLELGWCWLPAHLPLTTTHVSQAGWNFVRFCCAFLSPLFYLISGGWALYSLAASAGGPPGEASSLLSSVTSAAERCPSIIMFRVLGLCLYPVAAFAFCIAARFDPSPPDANSTEFLDAVSSFLVPLIGCVNSLVFLATEKTLCSLCSLCCCSPRGGDFSEYAMLASDDAARGEYLRGSLSHVSAMGFAAAVRAISCDAVPGGHSGQQGLAPHIVDDMRDARQRIDERLTSRGPSPSATQSRSPTLS